MSNSQINLPKTAFSMKANLPVREPEILEYWQKINLYQELRNSRKGKEKFVLHDGPPYANGNIHMGTALNKILKDIIVKFHQMDGKDSIYVPGWDCHGLPIEWKIEEQYKKNKKNKNDVPIVEFRKECRSFAEKWIEVHKGQFKRLGVVGDWENYYSTMSFDAEAQIVRELGKFLKEGSLYRGFKPVLWSTVEKTALADAEVEYQDHKSDTIYTSFPIKKSNLKDLVGSEIIIWTTTPWTIPANRALAYNEALDYIQLELKDDSDFKNRKIVVAEALLQSVINDCKIKNYKKIKLHVEKGFFTYEGGYQATEKILKKNVSAIFCADDTMAFGCQDYIKKNTSFKKRNQIEIIGYGDISMSSWKSYDLTTVRQPIRQMSKLATQLINEFIKDPDFEPINHIVQGRLIKRNSTR